MIDLNTPLDLLVPDGNRHYTSPFKYKKIDTVGDLINHVKNNGIAVIDYVPRFKIRNIGEKKSKWLLAVLDE